RQGNETAIVLRRERNDLGKGHLGDVEFRMHKKAIEHFLDGQLQYGEIDTLHLHRAVAEVSHVVVCADGETQGELGHVTEDAWWFNRPECRSSLRSCRTCRSRGE